VSWASKNISQKFLFLDFLFNEWHYLSDRCIENANNDNVEMKNVKKKVY
jgi:hypothetical protein